ncbi:hypothetical protein [Azorhizobium doebereinerae]|uniref:hypothetical protein n=1 Tax=Azorhizobium doebereinerae TaxID=281091 RepID=UPI0012EBA6FE|nr:hypothetical protein [Azorhizobium doebereinerae]
MARNRIEMSNALFGRLTERAQQLSDPVTNPDAGRWLKAKDSTDLALMAAATVATRIVTRQIRLVRIEHDHALYFCTFGLPEVDGLPPGLETVDATPGLFALAVLDAEIRPLPSVTAAEIKQVMDDQFKDSGAGYEGHDLDEIEPLFPQPCIYRVTQEEGYHALTDRVLGSILVRTYFDGPISLEPETVDILTRVFEVDSPLIPFRNIVQGILSISWENLFLETYRCIEQLYGMKRYGMLKTHLNYANSPRELAKIIDEQLSWRPKESEAFVALAALCDETLVSTVCTGLAVQADTHDKRCSKMAEALYDLRNTIVHYRPANQVIYKTDADWNVIVRGVLDMVAHLYNEHGGEFFG